MTLAYPTRAERNCHRRRPHQTGFYPANGFTQNDEWPDTSYLHA